MKASPRFSVSLSFEEVRFPPFQDILLLGRKCPQGKVGVSKCLNLLAPEKFELVEVNGTSVEAILVNKVILQRMPVEKVVKILEDNVFPFVSSGECVRVEFDLTIYLDGIEGTL